MTAPEEIVKGDPWSLVIQLLKWILAFRDWKSWLGFIVLLGISITCLAGLLRGLRWVLEQVASIVTQLRKIKGGLHEDNERILAIRLRQQFCTVMRSDMDVIAKAENWNDQWFTDLEAEVEAEGGYYRTVFDRLLNRRTSGSRRESSLMKALNNSAERCLLLVGEPGSGKSVAMRHLARKLADDGTHSTFDDAPVPLYVNLRELPNLKSQDLTADGIQRFVLDNIRRGDADTAAYVREKWQAYKMKGVWLFLFDSFDEIPAILHAATGSSVVRQYSNAIRQFMDGMGACRGILASREFKGPEAIPWSKLRILALDTSRQDLLISNALLTRSQQQLTHRHLASSDGTVFRNPLFLSLLCRYVRDKDSAPNNDYDLVYQQIERLAKRDVDYLWNKYGLKPDQLLSAAKQLAALFAVSDELGLSPRWELIELVWGKKSPVDVADVLAALVDVKIGRADVKEAKPGDRFFAFSHRRYQETLFVDYLAKNSAEIPIDFLLNAKWREYAVTFLQSQPAAVCACVVANAADLLEVWSKRGRQPVLAELGGIGHFFEWVSHEDVHVLHLLQQSFSQRLGGAPQSLRDAAAGYLMPRWEEGDTYDRWMALQFASLLPSATAEWLIARAIEDPIDEMRSAAFVSVGMIGSIPDKLKEWVCAHLADSCLLAENQVELSKAELLCAKLPISLKANVIFARCRKLRSRLWPIVRVLDPLYATFIYLIDRSVSPLANQSAKDGARHFGIVTAVFLGVFVSVLLLLISVLSVLFNKFSMVALAWMCLGIAGCGVLRLCVIYSVRTWPGELGLMVVLRIYWLRMKATVKSRDNWLIAACLILITSALALTKKSHWILGVLLAGIYGLGAIFVFSNYLSTRRAAAAAERALKMRGPLGILEVTNAKELNAWMSKTVVETLKSLTFVRSLLRLVEQLPLPSNASAPYASRALFGISVKSFGARMQQVLLGRVRELQRKATE